MSVEEGKPCKDLFVGLPAAAKAATTRARRVGLVVRMSASIRAGCTPQSPCVGAMAVKATDNLVLTSEAATAPRPLNTRLTT